MTAGNVMVLGIALLVFVGGLAMFVASLRERPPVPPISSRSVPRQSPRAHRSDEGPMAMVQAPDGVWRFR